MITLLLTWLALGQDVPVLQHAEPVPFTFEDTDPVTAGLGPRKTFRYEVESEEAVLFVSAESEESDLVLRVRFEESDAAATGPAALFAGRRRDSAFEDDDSGGLGNPFLRIERQGGGSLIIEVIAKTSGASTASVRIFEGQETAESRSLPKALIAEASALLGKGDDRTLLAIIRRGIATLLERPETRSASITSGLWVLGLGAHELGDRPAARSAWMRCWQLRSKALPSTHEDLQAVRLNLGLVRRELGDAAGALELEGAVWDVRRRALPEEHPDCLIIQQNYALTLAELSRFDEAQVLQERLLALRLSSLPDEHPEVQRARQNLATTHYARGDLAGAKQLQESVLDVFERTLPDDHPELQSARQNLAATLQSLGDSEAAIDLFERVLEIRERTLPADHELVQDARGNLALACEAAEHLSRALELRRAEVASWTRTRPPDHPDVLAARQALGVTLLSIGRAPEAAEIFESVWRTRRARLPEDHPDLQMARQNLAVVVRELGDPRRALELEKQVLDSRLKSLPASHPDVLDARSNLVLTLRALGDFPAALEQIQQALDDTAETLPPDDPRRINLIDTLAIAHFDLGDFATARSLFEEVLARRNEALPSNHPDRLHTIQNLAACLHQAGEPQRARRLFEEALEELGATYGPEHPSIVLTRQNLAVVWQQLGELDEARSILEEVVESLASRNPDGHALLVSARLSLASLQFTAGEFERARSIFEIVYRERQRSLPPEHPDRLGVAGYLATACAAVGDIESARKLAREALQQILPITEKGPLYSTRELEALLGAYQQVLDTSLSIANGLGYTEPDDELERLAFRVIEALRAASGRAAVPTQLPTPELRALRDRFAAAHRRIVEWIADPGRPTDFTEAVRERDRLERALLAEIRNDPSVDGAPAPRADEKTIAERLGVDRAGVTFWRYRRLLIDPETKRPKQVDAYAAWVVRPERPLVRLELGPAVQLESAIESWHSATVAKGSERAAALLGRSVRQLLFDPLRSALGDATYFVIAPAEALHQVPLAALPDEGEAVLGDRYRFTSCVGLSDWASADRGELAPPSLLAIGGVAYDGEPRAEVAGQGAAAFSMRGRRTRRFESLTSTGDEVRSIAALFESTFESAPARVLSGEEASRTALETLGPAHRFLHIATHGWFAADSVPSTSQIEMAATESRGVPVFELGDQVRGLAPAALCGLAFAGANAAADTTGRVQGVMTAEEIRALDLGRVELCVLSACETNVGLRRGGQGIASLQAALHAAGVRTAITSLWRVPDAPTRELMTELYRQLWIEERPVEEALWAAQQLLRNRRDEQGRPRYSVRDWAGWVLSTRSD
ncbi:MAG: tetratricopeptide repeat protein [Planctomycetota bacterium]